MTVVSSELAPPPFRYARTLFLSLSAAAFAALFIIGRAVILPFLLAVLLAYVLFPAVRLVERTRAPRWLAILFVYAVSIGCVTAFGWAVVPRLFQETTKLSAELPKLTEKVRDEWLPAIDNRLRRWTKVNANDFEDEEKRRATERAAPIVLRPREDGSYELYLQDQVELKKQSDDSWLLQPVDRRPERAFSTEQALRDAFDRAVSYAQRNSLELLELGRAIVAGVTRGIFYFFITLMLAGYMMYTFERIHKFVRDMWPAYRRDAFDRFVRRLDRGMAGVVRGQLLICLVNGVLSAIGFWFFGLKYWPILSLIAAAMSIIPIFGSILSSVPAVMIGLTQGFGTALGVFIWILAIHQLEANFLNPKIIGDQAHIHPVLVVFALLVGEHFFQIIGALLAVPTLALAQAVFLHFRESVLGIHHPRASEMPPPEPSRSDDASAKPPTLAALATKSHEATALGDGEE